MRNPTATCPRSRSFRKEILPELSEADESRPHVTRMDDVVRASFLPKVSESPQPLNRFGVELLFRLLGVLGRGQEIPVPLKAKTLKEVAGPERFAVAHVVLLARISSKVIQLKLTGDLVTDDLVLTCHKRFRRPWSHVAPGHTTGLGKQCPIKGFVIEHQG